MKKKTDIERVIDEDSKKKLMEFKKELLDRFNIDVSKGVQDYKIKLYTTGILNLDDALNGGLPVGMITELWGEEQSGKTLISLLAIAEMQKSGKACLYIDAEYRFNPEWAKILGVNLDPDMFTFVRKNTVQEVFEIIRKAAYTRAYGLIVLDSIGALTTLDATRIDMVNDTFRVGGIAGTLTECGKLVIGPLAETETSLIVINQQRDTIGVLFGSQQKHSVGGNFLKHAGSVRIRVFKPSSSKLILVDNIVKGVEIRCSIEKSSISANFREASFRIDYEKGLDREYDIITLLEDKNIITKSGAFYSFKDKKFHGFDRLLEEARNNKEFFQELLNEAKKCLGLNIK